MVDGVSFPPSPGTIMGLGAAVSVYSAAIAPVEGRDQLWFLGAAGAFIVAAVYIEKLHTDGEDQTDDSRGYW